MKRFISLTASLVFLGLVITGILQRSQLVDFVIAKTYDLQPAAQSLLPQLKLTDRGELLYRASRAEILDGDAFNAACSGVHQEHSVVLGCYAGRRLYIYNVTDDRLEGVAQVTATHELLHAVYDRLSDSEKSKINQLLEKQLTLTTDKRLLKTIALYDKNTTRQRLSELHSIFGTEVAKLSSGLEAHYKTIFKDRSAIVSFSQKYEQTFTKIEDKIADFDKQLAVLEGQQKLLEQQVDSKLAQLNQTKQTMEEFRREGKTANYNKLVPTYNQMVASYNASVVELKSIVSSYNSLVTERNKLAITQKDLATKLDSRHSQL